MSSPDARSIRDLKRQIIEGLSPLCPFCGGQLAISRKKRTESGGFGYTYKCENPQCELKPGIAQASVIRTIRIALSRKTVQIALSSLGSITLAGIIAFSSGLIQWSTKANQKVVTSASGANSQTPISDAPFHVLESSYVLDLTKWQPLTVEAQSTPQQAIPKRHRDLVVRTTEEKTNYILYAGTNGFKLDWTPVTLRERSQFRETPDSPLQKNLKHSYNLSVDLSQFRVGETIEVSGDYVFWNAFPGATEEWWSLHVNYPTDHVFVLIAFPESKPCKSLQISKVSSDGKITELPPDEASIIEGGRFVFWSYDHLEVAAKYVFNWKW
jgi:hypothetical protein